VIGFIAASWVAPTAHQRALRACRRGAVSVRNRTGGAGRQPIAIVLLLVMLGILAGSMQVLFGFIGIGKLIKYIPIPW